MSDERDFDAEGKEALEALMDTSPEPNLVARRESLAQEPSLLEEEPTPEEAVEIRARKKARIAQLMTRGILNSRLSALCEAVVPDGRFGKFVRDESGSIIRFQNLGYDFVYREDKTVEAEMDANNRISVGDVVLMTISKDDHEILKEIRVEGIQKKLGASRKEYQDLVARGVSTEGAVAGFDDSSTTYRESTQSQERGA